MKFFKSASKRPSISGRDFIVAANSNLFIGGGTGRTGTTWLMRVLGELLQGRYVTIGEHGAFVLSQFRNAGYEYYQVTPGNAASKRQYLQFFHGFMVNHAYDRHSMYGEGLRGLSEVVPPDAIEMAFAALEQDLAQADTLPDCQQCFGTFYGRLLNYAALERSGSVQWISKEPPYGRHARDLYEMIPACRLVVLVRDGRDVALSMARRGWQGGDILRCIDRWRAFTGMTVDALQTIPPENYLLLKYEDLIDRFEESLQKVFACFGIDFSEDLRSRIAEESFVHKPRTKNTQKWSQHFTSEATTYFESVCGELMAQLQYEV